MTTGQYVSRGYTPDDLDVPEDARRLAEEVGADHAQRERAAVEARAERLGAVLDRGRMQVRESLGTERWVELRRRMREARADFFDLFQPPADRGDEYDALNAARIESVHKFLADAGVSTERLRAIHHAVNQEVAGLVPAVNSVPGYADWLHPAERPVRAADFADDPHAWRTFRAPYGGWQTGHSTFSSGGSFAVNFTHHLDTNAGLVGNTITLTNTDASDFDNGWAVLDTQVKVWFQAPVTGVVETFIEARAGRGLHSVQVTDEFGTSDSSTTQQNWHMAHVLHPNVSQPSFGFFSRFNLATDNNANVQREYIRQGQVYTSRLFSDGPIPQGQWVEIRVGTRSQDGSITNDMEIRSLSEFRWFLQAVSVRIAP
jgi:hypothetical protein